MAATQDNRILRLSTPLAYNFLLISSLRFSEGLSELFHGEIEMVHEEESEGYKPTPVDPKEVIGKPMNITVEQRDKTKRFFDGICVQFTRSGRGPRFTKYKAVIVPKVWTLTQSRQSRIFQLKSVPEILKKVLEGYEVDYEIQGTFEPRNYCVQYRESDWAFASRLMEEEGIYYYFKHTEDGHRMIVANTSQSHKPCPAKAELPFEIDVSENKEEWMGAVHAFEYQDRLRTGKTELWDYHFQIQDNNLMATQTSIFDIGKNKDLEVYDFPGGYAKRFDGIDQGGGEQPAELQKVFDDRERTVKIRQEEFDVDYRSVYMVSSSCAPTSGHRFKLTKHANGDYNIDYVLVSLVHEVYQSPDYNSGEELKNAYTVTMACIPHGSGQAPYRPPQKTPKPIVYGSQTAIVTGPKGEEIFVDKFGRVKVQFHWDREGKGDAKTSCWLRVGTSIAGNKWGSMFIPRVGQEVIVDFMEGDPDQPIIVGEVYNPKNMPHYELPKYKTLSYIKTHSTPKGDGFNELRFEDKKGKEQVFVHSEKRYDLRVKGSMYETCGGDRQEVIGMRSDNKPGGNLAISVGGNFDLHVKGDHYIGIDKKLFEGVKSDVAEEYKGKLQTVVTAKSEHNAREITLEAFSKISLRVGATCIILDLSGVTIKGPMVKINSGGAAAPTSPMTMGDPLDAEWSDNGEPGYLDRPRPPGAGGGRRWRTVNGQHAPIVTDQAFALTRAAGHGDDLDRALVAAELSKMPPHVLQRMSDNGTTVVVGRGSVTDIDPSLAGQQPRGWPAGSTWDTVPGAYDPNTNQVNIATRGHGTPDGPYVPPTGDGHGSSNLVIHESMHSVDGHGPGGNNISSTDPNFTNARNNDPAIMADGYEGTANPAGAEEAYAESAARYYGGDPNDAASHPGVHNYWGGDPLNPNPPAPAGP